MPLAACRESSAPSRSGMGPGLLAPRERTALFRLLDRVRREVPATLHQASLFGSRARGDARPDSDLDVLLLFQLLPPFREPQATCAERIAAEIAGWFGIPLSVWCVSLADLVRGRRTPMLVDALRDAVPFWCAQRSVRPVPFTAQDALFCARILLVRVEEGSAVFGAAIERGDRETAAWRLRDDITRLCTAWLLLHGITRPRRAEAVLAFVAAAPVYGAPGTELVSLLGWARQAWGPNGRDATWPAPLPIGGFRRVGVAIEELRSCVHRAVARVESSTRHPPSESGPAPDIQSRRPERSPRAPNLPPSARE